MKRDIEEKALKAVTAAVNAEMKRKKGSTSICPVIFHQPKRPQKSNA